MRDRFTYAPGSAIGSSVDDPALTIIGRPAVDDTLCVPSDCAHPAAGTHQRIVAIDMMACPLHRDHAVRTYALATVPAVYAADCPTGGQIYWYTRKTP